MRLTARSASSAEPAQAPSPQATSALNASTSPPARCQHPHGCASTTVDWTGRCATHRGDWVALHAGATNLDYE